MPTIETPYASIEYLDEGATDGPTVVLVHGFPDDPSTWDGVVERLGQDVRTIRPYLRGHGRTRLLAPDEQAGGAQVAALARDLLDLADALNLERFFLVGHDWGARTAHAAAVLAPQRLSGLLTLATAYGPMTHLSVRERYAEASVAWYRWWFCTDLGARAFIRDPGTFARYAWETWSPDLRLSPAQVASLLASFDTAEYASYVVHYYRHGSGEAPGRPRYADDQAVLDSWPAITVATTFLYGRDDACEIVEAGRGNGELFAGDYERIELPGVGHFIQRERPELVADVIARRIGR